MFYGISSAQWRVEGYCELVQGVRVEVAENEVIAMLQDAATHSGAIRVFAWLRGLEEGKGDPQHEPDIFVEQRYLKYRCQGNSVVIFCVDHDRLSVDVLRFAASASGHPLVSDLKLSEARLRSWRG